MEHSWHAAGLLALLLVAAAPVPAADAPQGRWVGQIEVPGQPQTLVLDLDRDGAHWIGSITLPGRRIKGAPLAALRVEDGRLQADADAALPFPIQPGARLELLAQGDQMAGTWRMAGLEAPVLLRRHGPAQVDRPEPSSALAAGLVGRWRGRYEIGGVAREVTLRLDNGPDGRGRGELRIVGPRTSDLVVDQVQLGREYLTLLASAVGFRIEGRYDMAAGRIDGGIVQGPFEAPLVLQRVAEGGRR